MPLSAPRILTLLTALALLVALHAVASTPAPAAASASASDDSTYPFSRAPRHRVQDLMEFPDCVSGPLAGYQICDSSLPWQTRAASLVSLLDASEKISRLGDAGASIDRIGLPAYEWWSEALHGVGNSPGVTWADPGEPFSNATSFPMPINLGAAFDDALVHQVASTISTEARAFSNVGRAGLDFWTPNINPFRDPRWGRGQETPGEDPYHLARYVYSLVTGLQVGEDSRYYKVVADCKHFAGYDIEQWYDAERYTYNAVIAQNDLVEYYLPPFESCVRDAHVGSIMCAFNAVNGVPMCANEPFIQGILRDSWGLDGWVVSDCDAVYLILYGHGYTNTSDETMQVALQAGVDIDCGQFYQQNAQQALQDGAITESLIDRALINQFGSLVRLGYFDDPKIQPYRQYGADKVNTPAAQQLALTAALESFVLLKNTGVLPLSASKVTSIAVIGPLANSTYVMEGSYQGVGPYFYSITDGFAQVVPNIKVTLALGVPSVANTSTALFAEALKAAAAADVVVYAGGADRSVEQETLDRYNITLPGVQLELIQQLEQVGKPIVALMFGGGQVDLTYLRDSANTSAIMWVGYPGQSGGVAIVQTLFGLSSPAGRLPVTQYPGDYVNEVPMTDQSLRNSSTNPGRTYKFYTGKAVYPFGWGLSYTTFSFSWGDNETGAAAMDLTHAEPWDVATSTSTSMSTRPTFNIQTLMRTLVHTDKVNGDRAVFTSYSVNVTNTGSTFTSDVAVLGFLTNSPNDEALREQAPISELYAYDRVYSLAPGATTTVNFYVTMRQVSMADAVTGDRWVHPGVVRMFIDVERKLEHEFELVGEPELLQKSPVPPQAQAQAQARTTPTKQKPEQKQALGRETVVVS